MSFDPFENKIKDSLEKGTPAFEESSWHKMETMLDKHMPQKKDDRRKIIFFIFLFLLLGGGTVILLNHNKSESKAFVETNKSISSNAVSKNESARAVDKNEKTSSASPLINNIKDEKTSVNNNSISNNKTRMPEKGTTSLFAEAKQANPNKKIINKKEIVPASINTDRGKISTEADSNNIESDLTNKPDVNKTAELTKNNIEKTEALSNEKKDNVSEKNISKETIPKSVRKQRSILNNILINFSTGPDISSVGNNTGKIQMMIGAGLGYKISDRLTIRSGIFTGNKNYAANPEDYNPPSNFWAYYPNLKSISADCKVLEIPFNIDYNFGFSKNRNWFVSAGVSSLIMKKEEYNYYYKPANSSQYVYYSRTYKNANKHYFSILNLSGGFSREINSNFTLQAEPYLKIALNGVGYGKVKLNSTGLILTARIQPFHSKSDNRKTKRPD